MNAPRPFPVVTALALALGSPNAAAAQDTMPALPASLLRRLAEAVDGYRTGQRLHVVAARRFPHDVLGVFSDSALAAGTAREAGPGYGAFGPYYAPVDPGNAPVYYTVGDCAGHRPGSKCPPTDTTRVNAVARGDVISITVTIRPRVGPPVSQTWGPDEFDAIFLTLSAFDKFAVPYYTRLYGPAFAADMRQAYVRAIIPPTGR